MTYRVSAHHSVYFLIIAVNNCTALAHEWNDLLICLFVSSNTYLT